MSRLSDALERFLTDRGALRTGALGPKSDAEGAPDAETVLIARLRTVSRSASIGAALLTAVCLGLLIGGCLTAWNAEGATGLYTALGASGTGTVATLAFLRRVWRDKITTELVISLVPELPAKQQIDLVQTLYFQAIHGRKLSD